MRSTFRMFARLPVAVLLLGAPPARSTPPIGQTIPADLRDATSSVAESCNRFTFDLYRAERAEPGNLFLSPFSVSAGLTMAYAGAAGKTRQEMAQVLRMERGPLRLHEGWQMLLESLESPARDGLELHVANRLWGQQGFQFLDSFLKVTRVRYGAELAALDFQGDPEASRQAINGWVLGRTSGKIAELLPHPLDAGTRLVLTNTAYFNGTWLFPFETFLTRGEFFFVDSKRKTHVAMMHERGEFRYARVDGNELLELPYEDHRFSMLIVLPPATKLPALEHGLDAGRLEAWDRALEQNDVIVTLPKFRLESTFTLAGTLASMGMKSAFDPEGADFSGMTGDRGLWITQVHHKAFVDVNERGTEAAAATGDVVAGEGIERREIHFTADHPFLFLIRDSKMGIILFIGRLVDPGA